MTSRFVTTIDEGRVRLAFGGRWFALKWDDSGAFQKGIGRVQGSVDGVDQGTRAVDVVGILDESQLYLFELKDFRTIFAPGHPPQTNALAYGGRWKELPLEIALKVRDTLAGLAGVVSLDSPPSLAGAIRKTSGRPVVVFAFVFQDLVRRNEPEQKRKARDSELLASLRQKLAWLTRTVFVIDPLHEDVRAAGLRVGPRPSP